MAKKKKAPTTVCEFFRDLIGEEKIQSWELILKNQPLPREDPRAGYTAADRLDTLIDRVFKKLPKEFKDDPKLIVDLDLLVEPEGEYSTYQGDAYITDAKVYGLVCLVGEITSVNTIFKLYPKFVSKPFWQYAGLKVYK